MITSSVLIVAWIIAASWFITKKIPSMKGFIDKIMPYQGWLWLLLLIWFVFDLISLLGYIWPLFEVSVLAAIISIIAIATELVVGFILWYNLIVEHVLSKSKTAKEKAAKIKNKLIAYEAIFGFMAIILWILLFVLT